MSVYQRTNASGQKRWRYDFQWGGERHLSQEPHYASEAKAKAAERKLRRDLRRGDVDVTEPVRRSAAPRANRSAGPSLAEACQLYWNDHGKHHRSHRDIKRRLEIVQRLIGAETQITQIRFATVNDAVQARRKEKGRLNRPLAPGTVNLDVVDQLRPVLNHAGLTWEIALPPIAWKKLRLAAADKIVREYSGAELDRWDEELSDADARFFLKLKVTYGPRLGELFFPPKAFRSDGTGEPVLELGAYLSKEREWRTSRKDGSLHLIHLLPEDAEELAWRVARAIERGWDTIWTLDDGAAPASYYAMRGRIARASKRASIAQGRVIHGARHHAGTNAARTSILHAKELLGHRQISTTDRYSHLSGADMRDATRRAVERVSGAKTGAKSPAQVPPGEKGRSR